MPSCCVQDVAVFAISRAYVWEIEAPCEALVGGPPGKDLEALRRACVVARSDWGPPSEDLEALGRACVVARASVPGFDVGLKYPTLFNLGDEVPARHQSRMFTNSVLKAFRKLDLSVMDITDGVPSSLVDDQGHAIVFCWKIYVHGSCPEAVGSGITKFFIVRQNHIFDRQHDGPRVDFLALQASGHVLRMHPGKHREGKILFMDLESCHPTAFRVPPFSRSTPDQQGGLAAGAAAGNVLVTVAGLSGLADIITRETARWFLSSITPSDKEWATDLTDCALFSWPRFIAGMPDNTRELAVGGGITRFQAGACTGTTVFVMTRHDQTQVALHPGVDRIHTVELTLGCTSLPMQHWG